MSTYKRYRFHLSIISYAVWIYFYFNLSFRDIEDLLAKKGDCSPRGQHFPQ